MLCSTIIVVPFWILLHFRMDDEIEKNCCYEGCYDPVEAICHQCIDVEFWKSRCKWPWSCCLTGSILVFLISMCFITLLLFIVFFVTRPNLPSGKVVVGSSDVVLVSSFIATDLNTIHFNIDKKASMSSEAFSVDIYQELCSELPTNRQIWNKTRQMPLSENMQYRIEEPYLIKGSRVTYIFTALQPQFSSSCVVNIYIFQYFRITFNLLTQDRLIHKSILKSIACAL